VGGAGADLRFGTVPAEVVLAAMVLVYPPTHFFACPPEGGACSSRIKHGLRFFSSKNVSYSGLNTRSGASHPRPSRK
jgi:hypothetical protein